METKKIKTVKLTRGMVFLAVFVLLSSFFGSLSQALAQVTCFPTCEEKDDRFLVLAGSGLETLAGDTIEIGFAAPSSAAQFTISIFDGDTGGKWDRGTVPMDYTLYADPRADGTGNAVVGVWSGSVMPDNAWFDIPVNTTTAAQAQSGNYFYRLVVTNPDQYAVGVVNAFKVKTDGVVTMKPQAFAYVAAVGPFEDFYTIYPNYPDLTTTTYNGGYEFHVYLPGSSSFLTFWDGDLDFGADDNSTRDTNDPDTPNNILPPWAVGTQAVYEGVAKGYKGTTGDPNDDTTWSTLTKRSPSVIYQVVFPDGKTTFTNNNPSGNREWEQFKIGLNATVPDEADYAVTARLSSGLYHVHLIGLDIFNLAAWRFFNDVVGVCKKEVGQQQADPCKPLLQPYLVGNTIWIDTNRNGIMDGNEVGREGVVLELLDGYGQPVLDSLNNAITTKTTDISGHYSIEVQGRRVDVDPLHPGQEIEVFDGNYKVRVAAENFYCGDNVNKPGYVGPLCGYTLTNLPNPYLAGNTIGAYTVIDQNIMDYNFGYYLPLGGPGDAEVSIGDKVWLDKNMNGIQDPGEPGIPNVTLTLYIDINRDGNYNDDKRYATTGSDGSYLFPTLLTGANYKIVVDDSNFGPGGALYGYVPTKSLAGSDRTIDSNGSPAYTSLPLSNGAYQDLSIDFGFGPPPAIGDKVWWDYNGDGIQDSYEPGIAGVKLTLTIVATGATRATTTASDGSYSFNNLSAGKYIVTVDPNNFVKGGALYGLSLTKTLAGSDRAVDSNTNPASVTLSSGSTGDYTIDFGFRDVGPGPGERSHGYYKKASHWPAGVTSVIIGTTTYTTDQAIVYLSASNPTSAIKVFRQLVTVILSLMEGSNPTCIASTVAAAQQFMALHPVESGYNGPENLSGTLETFAVTNKGMCK